MQSIILEGLHHRSLSDVVFAKLKGEILQGALLPGDRLRQLELSMRYDVSRAPVRDALKKLTAEGLVEARRGGAVVSSIDLDYFMEIYQIREALETLAARLAVTTITDENLATLAEKEKEVEQASLSSDLLLWLQLDQEFHHDLIKSCNKSLLLKMIDGLWNCSHYIRRQYITQSDNRHFAEQTHKDMIEALAKRDGKRFERLVRAHIRETTQAVKQFRTNYKGKS